MSSFVGDHLCKVDVKGRIILPVALQKQMPPDARDHFIVRKDVYADCLVLYAMDDWNRQLLQIRRKLNPFNREHSMFLRNFFRGTAELFLDNNNRMLIPRRLLELIGAGRDVILAGQDGKIEIWAADKYSGTELPGDDFANMAERFLGGSVIEPEG
ncbi:MAG: division/cell wall cluster transcriptional repressor MraZ [Bacteroidales bacterium]|nr:division/cell wall cluster transcriptional repressor MraZ [Bacteroidales bacterium]